MSPPPLHRGLARRRREEFFKQRGSLTIDGGCLPLTESRSASGLSSLHHYQATEKESSSSPPDDAGRLPPALPSVSIVTDLATSSDEDTAVECFRYRYPQLASSSSSDSSFRMLTARALTSPYYSRRLMLPPPSTLDATDEDDGPRPPRSAGLGPKQKPPMMTLTVPLFNKNLHGGSNSSLSSGYYPGSSRSGTCSPVSPLASPAFWSLGDATSPVQFTLSSRDASPSPSPRQAHPGAPGSRQQQAFFSSGPCSSSLHADIRGGLSMGIWNHRLGVDGVDKGQDGDVTF